MTNGDYEAVHLMIDCGFHGLTPLYAAEELTVE